MPTKAVQDKTATKKTIKKGRTAEEVYPGVPTKFMTKLRKVEDRTPEKKEKKYSKHKPMEKAKYKPKKKKEESYAENKKRKATGSAARRQKREKIKKKINNMGIFKELKKEQASRS